MALDAGDPFDELVGGRGERRAIEPGRRLCIDELGRGAARGHRVRDVAVRDELVAGRDEERDRGVIEGLALWPRGAREERRRVRRRVRALERKDVERVRVSRVDQGHRGVLAQAMAEVEERREAGAAGDPVVARAVRLDRARVGEHALDRGERRRPAGRRAGRGADVGVATEPQDVAVVGVRGQLREHARLGDRVFRREVEEQDEMQLTRPRGLFHGAGEAYARRESQQDSYRRHSRSSPTAQCF